MYAWWRSFSWDYYSYEWYLKEWRVKGSLQKINTYNTEVFKVPYCIVQEWLDFGVTFLKITVWYNWVLLAYKLNYLLHIKWLDTKSTKDLSARSRYQGQGQVITSHSMCWMQFFAPALDICFRYISPWLVINVYYILSLLQCLKSMSFPSKKWLINCFISSCGSRYMCLWCSVSVTKSFSTNAALSHTCIWAGLAIIPQIFHWKFSEIVTLKMK